MSVSRQNKPESATANTGTAGPHVQHPLDMFVGGQKEAESPTADAGTGGSHVQPEHRIHVSRATSGLEDPVTMQSSAFFQNAHGFNINGSPNFHNQNIGSITNVYGGTDGLENLKGYVSFDAQFDSSAQDPSRRCHPGTRENVLKRLRDWFDNPKAKERISWLVGPAGAGKSAIAQTMARSYVRPNVAATFFFFRSDVNRNDGNRLFPTLAYQLAFSMPIIRDHIAGSLLQRPDLPRAEIETQFDQLLAHPFQALSRDATQQLAPAVHVIIDIFKKYQELSPVIIIDGIDECTDESLQQQLLKVIGDAVADDSFPLRFLIVSRPEVHIEQIIGRFQTPIRTVDLAELDDANQDIEKYLVDEFSRIASEQGLDPSWPGQAVIDDIVYKSSRSFIYASVVIKFVGDPYCFAKTQLDIVLNMKPPKTKSPFAVLDQLYLEILIRVPDQDFLKRYLALLTARISVSESYRDLHKDDAVLMHVSEEELHANLRRMRSLFVFKPAIDVHHKSFLDFLHDSSRSGQYYIGKQGGIMRYLEVFVDSFVRYVSTVIEQPDHRHDAPHFTPRFRDALKWYPPKIELPVNEWQEVIQPLLDLQDKFLQKPELFSTGNFIRCDECTVFHLLRELLQLVSLKGQRNTTFVGGMASERSGVISSIRTNTEKNKNDDDLESLFASLPETTENWSPNEGVIHLMSAILHLDITETAMRLRSVPDAQKLANVLVYMIHANIALCRVPLDAMRKASLLALQISARAPILPLSFFLNGNNESYHYYWMDETIPIQVLSQTIIASRVLDRRYIVPVLVVEGATDSVVLVTGDVDGNDSSMKEWRQTWTPSSVIIIQIMLRLAKAIQYFHSMGVVLYAEFGSCDVLLDSGGFRPKIRCLCSTSQSLLDKPWKERFSHKGNVFSFGCLFYELFSGVDTKPRVSSETRRNIIVNRPFVLEIPEYAWQLLQQCCAQEPESRPTMDEIVQEMESWKIK